MTATQTLAPSIQTKLALQKAEMEKQKAIASENIANQERQKAEKLAEKLRELGINPDEIS